MNKYLALACHSATCAPPPVGVGGSEEGGTGHPLWGKGIEALFPKGSGPVTPAPWPRARRSKKLKDYDANAVSAARREGKLEEIDPRDLRSTQPSVTAPGVRHYMNGDAGLYSDADKSSNQYPIVYERTGPDGVVERMLLSGHHRATAALLKGEKLKGVIVARGGFGGPR